MTNILTEPVTVSLAERFHTFTAHPVPRCLTSTSVSQQTCFTYQYVSHSTYVRTYLLVVVAFPKSKVWKAAHRVHSCEPCAIRREPGVVQTSSTFITLQAKGKQCQHSNYSMTMYNIHTYIHTVHIIYIRTYVALYSELHCSSSIYVCN